MTTTNNPYFYKEPCQDVSMNVHKYEEESELAKELRRRKLEQESKKRSAEQVIADSEEIKRLRQLVQQGYLNKERSKQLAEKQVRAID
jgi:regulator of sirC expression with transglutaminase-like and TPR domain